MGKALVNGAFATIYSIVFSSATTSFVLAAILLKNWNVSFGHFYCLLRITDTIGGPDNEKRILCYYLVYGVVPIMLVSIMIAFTRVFNFVQGDFLPTSRSAAAAEKCCKYNMIVVELIVDLVLAIYNLLYASIITAIYVATCRVYRESLTRSFIVEKGQNELKFCFDGYPNIRFLYEGSETTIKSSDPYVGPAEILMAIISLEYISTGLLLIAVIMNAFIFIRNQRAEA